MIIFCKSNPSGQKANVAAFLIANLRNNLRHPSLEIRKHKQFAINK
jgi:hypothetical protein